MSADVAQPAQTPDPYTLLPQVPSFELTSTGFAQGQELPDRHGFAAENLSPALAWSGAPQGTKSYVVSCFDPDAPTPSGFWHWFAVGLPAEVTDLAEGAGAAGSMPEGVLQLRNDYGSADFGGAAPPPGDDPHRYIFAVLALDVADPVAEAGVDADTSPAKASFLTLGHVIGRATLTGTFAIEG